MNETYSGPQLAYEVRFSMLCSKRPFDGRGPTCPQTLPCGVRKPGTVTASNKRPQHPHVNADSPCLALPPRPYFAACRERRGVIQ